MWFAEKMNLEENKQPLKTGGRVNGDEKGCVEDKNQPQVGEVDGSHLSS